MATHSNLIGGGIAFAVAVVSNYGVNLQKQLHRRLAADGAVHDLDFSYTHHCMWWVGMFLVGLGSVGDLVAFGFARAAVVAAVGGVTTIVANVVFAQWINKEPLHTTDVLGIICLIGAVLLLALVSRDEVHYDLAALAALFQSSVYLTYVALQALLLFGFGACIYQTKRAGLKSMGFAAISGTIGAMSVLLGKCTVEMVSHTIQGTYMCLSEPSFYGTALSLVMCVAAQTHCLNRSFAVGDIMAALPIFQMFWIGFAVVGDLVFYHTYTTFGVYEWLLYLLVLFFMVVGCGGVAYSRLRSCHTIDAYMSIDDVSTTKATLREVYL
ncbi:hypothetical protein ACHHYP_02598 [Achlya hypogyna]|uniref:Magnesium transporter n=1 Tax=Achlya hypogyna TaxID=1202772 RepID=A0A1V9ZRZ0_ACHHY|nr:hypothetical protein ACHHYP_02598 [Achlya hypogyna]